jgi:hypothetical protein
MHSEAVLLRGAGTSAGTATTTTAASVKLISDNSQCTTTAGGSGCCDSGDATAQNDNPISRPCSPATSPQLNQRSQVMNLNSNNNSNSSGTHAQNDSLILEDGQLRSLRDSNQDLSACVGGGGGAPLSPRPWYKRSIARDEKRCAPTTMGTSSGKKKSKSPDNLPEIQPGREGITVKENFEEKYSYFTRNVPAIFIFNITKLDSVGVKRKY